MTDVIGFSMQLPYTVPDWGETLNGSAGLSQAAAIRGDLHDSLCHCRGRKRRAPDCRAVRVWTIAILAAKAGYGRDGNAADANASDARALRPGGQARRANVQGSRRSPSPDQHWQPANPGLFRSG